jgi:hypothetical protein
LVELGQRTVTTTATLGETAALGSTKLAAGTVGTTLGGVSSAAGLLAKLGQKKGGAADGDDGEDGLYERALFADEVLSHVFRHTARVVIQQNGVTLVNLFLQHGTDKLFDVLGVSRQVRNLMPDNKLFGNIPGLRQAATVVSGAVGLGASATQSSVSIVQGATKLGLSLTGKVVAGTVVGAAGIAKGDGGAAAAAQVGAAKTAAGAATKDIQKAAADLAVGERISPSGNGGSSDDGGGDALAGSYPAPRPARSGPSPPAGELAGGGEVLADGSWRGRPLMLESCMYKKGHRRRRNWKQRRFRLWVDSLEYADPGSGKPKGRLCFEGQHVQLQLKPSAAEAGGRLPASFKKAVGRRLSLTSLGQTVPVDFRFHVRTNERHLHVAASSSVMFAEWVHGIELAAKNAASFKVVYCEEDADDAIYSVGGSVPAGGVSD